MIGFAVFGIKRGLFRALSGLVIVVFLLLTPSVIYALERAVDVAERLIVLCRRLIKESERPRREGT